MLFSELYSAYYNIVAEILRLAVRKELTEQKLKEAVLLSGFSESILTVPNAIKSEKWQLITENYTTPLKNEPVMPLTTLEKQWLKAISLDPRVKLFDFDFSGLEAVKPLFTADRIYYYDRYSDGDDFESPEYIAKFRIILKSIGEKQPLRLVVNSKHGKPMLINAMPECLEYSEKDDKFRLITSGCRYGRIINLSNILSCKPYFGEPLKENVKKIKKASITFTLFDGRNTLERAMLHFAHFEKSVKRTDESIYTVCLNYDPSDETELLIRILSFGPFIKVIEPDSFVNIIKERLEKQKKCGI